MDTKLIQKDLEQFQHLGLGGILNHIISSIRCAGHCIDITENQHFAKYLEESRKKGWLRPEQETLLSHMNALAHLPCNKHSVRDKRSM
ncbi:hypothetical protein CC99x_005470 [Candidatus Berkiella cookevillensis]|uniref:Uncharacterized protein n=1 Tax=Candidatus Berkiella cookevillensis TaxID=437022 RepID=A0A0Q9YVG4_9GAMM|nr:hypothetical protein [Candidatus Berkiella cookevillensis]MCS5708351.1 hypothetical protein [Candidatus Berkiella cookevillensis]